jgi:hypothetical protein
MTLHVQPARKIAQTPVPMADAEALQRQIDRELALVARLMVPEAAPMADSTRRAALSGLVGRWKARRDARQMPLAA